MLSAQEKSWGSGEAVNLSSPPYLFFLVCKSLEVDTVNTYSPVHNFNGGL